MQLPVVNPSAPTPAPRHAPGARTDTAPSISSLPPSLPRTPVPGLYVHVPFCFHKCHYCDFYSITRQTPERMDRFVDLLLAEARGWTDAADTPRGPTITPRTVFFGGGTPSLLPVPQMRRLLRGLRQLFDFSGLDEWTVECNPATVSPEYAALLREEGVNRLSFGAQSFDPRELQILERHHDPADVLRSVEIARSAGFHRLNVDLIYAIPGQDLASWSRSLHAALDLQTEHLSCYALTYESNTPMAVKKRLGSITAIDDDLELEMLHFTRRTLTAAGYHPYEVSNYARTLSQDPATSARSPGCTSGTRPDPQDHSVPTEACRHNLLYWNGGSYVGLGPSAASHVQGFRWRNRPHLGEWELAVQEGGIPTTDVEQLTPRQRAGELAMLQLRLEQGVLFDDFQRRTGFDARHLFADQLSHLSRVGLIATDDTRFHLTPRGLNVADAVAAEFLE